MTSNIIYHSGVGHEDNPPGRGSGRYAWGSGDNPGQHQFNFISEVKKLKANGLTEATIAKTLLGEKATSTDLRAEISIENSRLRKANVARAVELMDKYNGNKSEVARQMGINESSVRSLLDPIKAARNDRYQNTADMLKKVIAEKGIIDVSSSTEYSLGVNENTKKVAIAILEKEGYLKSWIQVDQLGTGEKTSMIVLAPPGTTHSEVQKRKFEVASIDTYTPDEGKTWWNPKFPSSLDSKRVMVRYAEEGGKDKDGVIELRRGVKDLSLGGSQYAQVRVMVDDTNYLKGMAMYAPDSDFPKGIDVIYNTNKKKGVPLIDKNMTYSYEDHDWVGGKEVAKRMKIDESTGEVDRDNPFGAAIKRGGQMMYKDKDGKEQLSPINKLQEEGDWDDWSRNLSSQFLAKQPLKLIKQQLDLTIKDKQNELEKITDLTNPVIKKKMLDDFAKICDSNASDLSAKGFKDQSFQVLLPIPKMKPNEVYAPNHETGDIIALVRFPHAGPFEIPVLKVNNNNPDAKKVMNMAKDAIGIHPSVAEQLSGADFDGDTAVVIPVSKNNLQLKVSPALKGLQGFEPKDIYKLSDDAPRMKSQTKQNEMGRVTNLIADMTVADASESEICRAVKHSMVVIDAEKHHLDYKQSAKDNDITDLKVLYQGGPRKGASTILTKARSEVYIDKRTEIVDRNKMTPEEVKAFDAGKKIYRTVDDKRDVYKELKNVSDMTPEELAVYRSGKKVYRKVGEKTPQMKVHRMDLVNDARDLVHDRDNEKEMAYADFANELKGLADKARAESRAIKPLPVNPSAKRVYAEEVKSLNNKLIRAKMNAPKERQAQRLGNAMVSEKIKSNPGMDFEHKQRARVRALEQARALVGAKKELIEITDKEWEAIQANAISTNKLIQILNNTDQEAFKKRATPKRNDSSSLTQSQINLIKSMNDSGLYSRAEIAKRLGVSVSTVSRVA